MNLQRMQEGCRRILAAVAVSWGHPEGWSFRVEDEGELDQIALTATHGFAEVGAAFTYEEIIHDDDNIERKVLQLYREGLRAAGRST